MRSSERVTQLLDQVQATPGTNFSSQALMTPDNVLRALICVKLEEVADALARLSRDPWSR